MRIALALSRACHGAEDHQPRGAGRLLRRAGAALLRATSGHSSGLHGRRGVGHRPGQLQEHLDEGREL